MNCHLVKLPQDITNQIWEYMWGSNQIYRVIFKKILGYLPNNPWLCLKATNTCHYKKKYWTDLEDNVYCHRCGEKSLDFAYACLGLDCDFCREM